MLYWMYALLDERFEMDVCYISGMVTAVGLSNLQYVDMNSSRNIFIVGVSIFFGLSMPNWMEEHGDAVSTGIYSNLKVRSSLINYCYRSATLLSLILVHTFCLYQLTANT